MGAGAVAAATAARIALGPESAAAAAALASASTCLSRHILSAPSGYWSSRKRPQQASTRARIFGELPPAFVAAASQRLSS